MEIKVSKTALQKAVEFTQEWVKNRGEIPEYQEGFAFLLPWKTEGFPSDGGWKKDGEKPSWCHFYGEVETDENSVHRGETLVKDGYAVFERPWGAIICTQWVTDAGWWEWHWEPFRLVVAV